MKTHSVRVGDDCSVVVDIFDGERDGFLLVHGLASNARMWDGVAQELNRLGHRVAIVDQRGHGRSGKPEKGYDFATISNDLALVTRHLQDSAGFPSVVAVGQSWGGAVVESFSGDFPLLVKGAVAVDGGMTHLSERFPDWQECKTVLAPPDLLGIPWSRFESMVRSRHPDWPETGINGVLANMERLADGTIRPWLSYDNHMSILWHLWQHNPYEVCSKLEIPILFVPAGGDPDRDQEKAAGLKRLSQVSNNSKIVWFDPSTHDIHAQHPVGLAKLLHAEIDSGIFS